MKIVKKIVLAFLVLFVLSSISGYIYFDQKFTPEQNYLKVENESGPVSFKWIGNEKNVLLLPIHFEGDAENYYLQFDTGSPYTVFYSKSIKNISQISTKGSVAKTAFSIGKTKIASDYFKIYELENDIKNDSIKIIGTIGADILENRKSLINFKESFISLNLNKAPASFQKNLADFEFKKRKIIIKGFLKGQEEDFLFDSGTSAYELLTSKEVWHELKLSNSKTTIEKSQSWKRVLTTYTADCNQNIIFDNQKIPLKNVTYVEGYSKMQYAMMKFSGMTGMLGNKIFLNKNLYLDCLQNKMGIE
ncbi:hypothetical protein EV143_1053 [Flavobacterium chryseum]|uniref:hypothetical protein n=1 Tax=Flavobacterium sp. P3160 TaxID=2512113 RepID=UPI00105DF3A6|nr:hypothetical protein [Flavobacterium sp. P3160]TDO73413.1 hypothetical protein EV143_1053 [Flavobacterium sp. P3160]